MSSIICCSQSHYIEVEQRAIFYKIWTDFGLVGNTEKKIGDDYEQLLRPIFQVLEVQKKIWFFKNILASALKTTPIRF